MVGPKEYFLFLFREKGNGLGEKNKNIVYNSSVIVSEYQSRGNGKQH